MYIPNCDVWVWNVGTAQIRYQENKCFWDEMLPQNITYTMDSSSHQLFDIKWTSILNDRNRYWEEPEMIGTGTERNRIWPEVIGARMYEGWIKVKRG